MKLEPKTAPDLVAARVVACSRVLDGLGGDDEQVGAVMERVKRIVAALDAILCTPRQQGKILKCRNPEGRKWCTEIATNRKRRLCRSCENREDYVRPGGRRERRRTQRQ